MRETSKFHFIGIGGIGMSALARILLKKKHLVSGSDKSATYITENLVEEGAKVFIGHSADQVPEGASIIYSSDIQKENPEFQTASARNDPMMHRSDLLLYLMKGYKTLSVTGTHGKTTTSALLTWVMKQANMDPTFAIGGIIPQFKSNAGHGEGDYFIAEADESDGTFLKYLSHGAIVTNIDSDHLNHYGSMSRLTDSFKQFLDQVKEPQLLFYCGDDPLLKQINPPGISYGFNENNRLKISSFIQKKWKIHFNLDFQGIHYSQIQLPLVGKHQALNGAAVFGLAISLGISEEVIRQAFQSFGGVFRRCEKKGEIQNILLLDDYAHHPTEIQTTLQGIRQAIGGRRLIVVFQPHRYSRTKECLGLYKGIFQEADQLFVTEIYSAGEQPIEGVSSEILIQEIKSEKLNKCHYIPRHNIADHLAGFACTHDVIVTLGAGDITHLGNELLQRFKITPPKKLKVGILFGGRSGEHEVTFLSAKHIIQCITSDLYETEHFGITKQGFWISGNESLERLKKKDDEVGSPFDPHIFQKLLDQDVLVPVLHGTYGEDGTIQGFFETLNKAYVGTNHTSASICMDKALTKHLMHAHKIPTLPFFEINHLTWKRNESLILKKIKETFKLPIFVKPVHLGSTVGVQKVNDFEQLSFAIQRAFQYDYKLIVEQGLNILRELEFAVLGNEEAEVFPPGEILSNGEIYDYESKYSPKGMKVTPCAQLSEEKIREGMKLALWAYRATECTGMARVDFFLDGNEKLWLNEINPIPGFTPNSLYPKICEVNGIVGKELLDQLIILALERKRRDAVLTQNIDRLQVQ